MRYPSSCFLFFALCCPGPILAEEFPGWEGLRVISQEGRPQIMRAADLNGNGREELVVVHNRASRLDIYSWLDEEDREAEEVEDKSRPNELPMAPEVKHTELALERIPLDVVIHDLDGDGRPELIVLVSPPNRVLVYQSDEEDGWSQQYQIDLLDGEISSRRESLLLRSLGDKEFQLLVSLSNGIQQLPLKPGGRAEWLTPREQRARINWWLADLDGDGYEDLVEQNRESGESIRWYRGSPERTLAPAAVLFDRSVKDVQILKGRSADDDSDDAAADELVLLDGSVKNLLRRYRTDVGEPNPFGERRPLALADAPKAAWCGMWQGADRVLVAADRSAPQLITYPLGEFGWGEQRTYPAVSKIVGLASPEAEAGTLLIWSSDAADLMVSRWKSERLTYPQPLVKSPEVEDRKILALGTAGTTTWWVQRVGKHLDLYRWATGETEAAVTRFEDASAKAEQALWIGGDRLLFKDAHARNLQLAVLQDEKTVVSSPAHLRRADLSEYRLVAQEEDVRLARVADGVLQWMDDDLQSHDQVMLSQGQELADYIAAEGTGGWALQKDAAFIHRIKVQSSGLSLAEERIRVEPAQALVRDPVLGVLLVKHDRVTHLSEGRPRELKLVEAVDERVGRSGGIRKTNFHRLGATDVDGDGKDELLLFDDEEHRIMVFGDRDGKLEPQIAWQVFDDKSYPYGDGHGGTSAEPRAVLGLDLDGDGHQDLALLCQDRLLIYLAREKTSDTSSDKESSETDEQTRKVAEK